MFPSCTGGCCYSVLLWNGKVPQIHTVGAGDKGETIPSEITSKVLWQKQISVRQKGREECMNLMKLLFLCL
ncbi:hypothetical protein chiPu_0000208 [Chiloscyllium punctatum]|uniref:Uncharacterized protein n=1 Tax=Chiloscyllium punctatum TaxID=137246 RepID=A0A401RUJ5_CHIPU|nr:hypothetical protein [Chiloscyllium punctatum]